MITAKRALLAGSSLVLIVGATSLAVGHTGLLTTNRLLGRDTAGTGQVEQLGVTGGIRFTGAGGIEIDDDGVGSAELDFIDGDTPADDDCVTIETGGVNGSLQAVPCSGLGGGDSVEVEDGDDANTFTAIVTTGRLEDSGDINWVNTANDISAQIRAAVVGATEIATDGVSADELNATGVEAELEAVLDLPSLQGDLALTTQTSGAYVGLVADGTGIDGTASTEGATYTPTLDLTEISSATLGAGAFTALTFDAGAVDPVMTFGSGTLTWSALSQINLDDEGEFRFFEEDAGGANYKGFKAPAAVTANTTCTFEDDASFIPDACVGNGVDDGAAGGDSITVNTTAVVDPDFDDAAPAAAAGGKNITWQTLTNDISGYITGATQSAPGVVEEATDAEIITATDADRYVTPAGLKRKKENFCVAVSDETTAITTGTAKITWRTPYAFTVTDVRASINTTSSSGVPTFDINEAGTTIISTKLTIDVGEETSTTAAAAAVISDTSLADDAEMTVDIDVAGTGAKGAKVCLIGYQT